MQSCAPRRLQQDSDSARLSLFLMPTHSHQNATIMGSEHSAWVLSTFAALDAPRYYVDLAANHPTYQSSSVELDQSGWRGVCIEPNPMYIQLLRTQRTCHVAPVAVDSVERKVKFHFSRGEMGGIEDEQFDNRAASAVKNKTGQAETVSTLRLQNVLTSVSAPSVMGYLSLDVEGAESAALPSSFAWDTFKFLTMTIERPPPDLSHRLFRHGYLFVRTIGRTDVAYIHESHPNANKWANNASFVQVPAKCRSDTTVYRERHQLTGVRCNSVFGCCTFPGFPQHSLPYVVPY